MFSSDLYVADILSSWIIVMLFSAALCFMISELARNYSQVDKLWSLMPIIYGGITLYTAPASPRLWIMVLLVTIWGMRLSYNFYRKGGYNIVPWKGEEDYRWSIMQQNSFLNNRFSFGLFNLFFISFYQHFLIMLFSMPMLVAANYASVSLTWLDYLAAFSMLFFISVETIADNQQFLFHQLKKGEKINKTKFKLSLQKGFLIEGLWKHSRHPNFLAEQAIWISFYFFSVAASGKWLNQSLVGALLLVLLFIGSTALTEKISNQKYPDYLSYKQTVPKFIPSLIKIFKKSN